MATVSIAPSLVRLGSDTSFEIDMRVAGATVGTWAKLTKCAFFVTARRFCSVTASASAFLDIY